MPVTAIEGVVHDGKVVISEAIELPDETRVYVVVPSWQTPVPQVRSPRLANQSDFPRYKKTVTDLGDDEVQ